MRNRFLRVLAASLAAALVLAACGSDDADTAAPEAPEPEPAAEEGEEGDDTPADGPPYETVFPVFADPSIPDLDIVFERDRFTIVMHTVPAENLFWSNVFDNVNVFYSDDPVAPLVSGAAWIVQAEPGVVWPALEQGVIDALTIGVTNDHEQWLMLAAPGIESPDDIEPGMRITGGTIGDSWNIVGRIIIRDHFGMDPDDLEWVSVSGGSDSRMDAVLAGQVDLAMAQLRNLAPVEEIGGGAVFNERVENAQTQFVVLRETWENNRDAVCAALEGHFAAVLWMHDDDSEYELDRMREVWPMFEAAGYDFEDPDALWIAGYPGTHSRDAGASVSALDTQMEVIQSADDPVISQDFNWRDHVDFSCLWELQEAYGVPLRPDPNEL